jgi:Integrase core domain
VGSTPARYHRSKFPPAAQLFEGESGVRRRDDNSRGKVQNVRADSWAENGDVFRRRVAGMGIQEVISAPSSPWQNPYVERLIGSVRRECLDHVIVFNEAHLRRILAEYMSYYHGARTHLALAKDAPTPRHVQAATDDAVIAFPKVGGLHHRYERRAA